MLNGELSRIQPDAAFVSFDNIMKETQEAVNNPDYTSDGGFLQRYEQDMASAATDEETEEVRRQYYKENPSFYLAAQKREFDGALLDMARSEYYEDVPAVSPFLPYRCNRKRLDRFLPMRLGSIPPAAACHHR